MRWLVSDKNELVTIDTCHYLHIIHSIYTTNDVNSKGDCVVPRAAVQDVLKVDTGE